MSKAVAVGMTRLTRILDRSDGGPLPQKNVVQAVDFILVNGSKVQSQAWVLPSARRDEPWPLNEFKKPPGCGANRLDFFFGVILLSRECPDGSGPSGIVCGAADNLNVHLPHLIANTTDIELFRLEMAGDEFADLALRQHHFDVVAGLKLVEIFDILDLGDENEPREKRVVF